MIDKKAMSDELIIRNLKGAWCEEFYYAYDSRELRLEKAGYLVGSNPDNRITSITPPEFEYNFNPKSDFAISSGINLKYAVGVKVADDKIYEATNTDVFISDDTRHYKCIPFTEYKKKSILIDPVKDNLKKDCRVLDFRITTEAYSTENEYIYNKYKYKLSFEVAIDQECYIYIIQTPDVTLPTVLVCRDRIGEFDLNDIIKYVYAGNIYEGIYNSCFHPHDYHEEEHKEYVNVVYGTPAGRLKDLKFEEEIKYTDDIAQYTTNDGIEARKIDNEIHVYQDNFLIGSYSADNKSVDYNCIDLFKYTEDKDIFNSLHDVESELTIDEALNYYPDLRHLIPSLDTYGNKLQHIKTGDRLVIMRFEDHSQDDLVNLVIRIPEENTVEVLYNINDKKEIYYSIYRLGHRLDIFSGIDENGKHVFYNNTSNRSINYSRDIALISYKENFWVNVDKANIVVNSNLPIVGEEFTRYNIFGVPEKF